MDMNSTMNTADEEKLFFGWLDFVFFISMLAVSTMIGIYFGIWGKKEDTPKEYLHGGKTMSTFPVAVSLVSSLISGVTMMGAPTEIYLYGTLYWLICVSFIFIGFIVYYLYLPVFYELQLTSTYEYLQLRFNRSVRILASMLYAIAIIFYIPIVIYVPALAFSQVSGLNVHIITPAISILCVFYTMMGGIKAVVWTDFLQGLVMAGASVVVIILGVYQLGGPGIVWQRSNEGGRIRVFEFNPSPFQRLTFWSATVGAIFNWTGEVCISQAMVQKFLSLPTLKKARRALILFIIGLTFVTSISCYLGLLIFAKYHDCDPISAKIVSRPDQLMPHYVMDISSSLPGLPGLFVAGIFSAALSSMSSCLNALGATVFEDFVRPRMKHKFDDKTANKTIKIVVVTIGAICVLLVFVVDKLGTVLQLTLSLSGVTVGTMLGVFTFGMFNPRGNSKGALAGTICSMLLLGWIVFGAQKAIADGQLKESVLPTSVEGCGFNVTLPAVSPSIVPEEEEVFILYRLSFLYNGMVGVLTVFIVGSIVSLLTEPPELENLNPKLYTPIVRKYVIYIIKNRYKGNEELIEQELLNIKSASVT